MTIAGGGELWGFPKKLASPALAVVDGTLRLCELVRHCLENVVAKGAWTGPAALELAHHALAPVARLPVLEVISGTRIPSDLTLGLGTVVFDYLAQPRGTPQ